MFGEETAVTGAEVELQSHRSFEFVFEAEDAVGTALAEVSAAVVDAKPTGVVGNATPAVSDAGPKTNKSVQSAAKSTFEHEVGIQFEIPNVKTFKGKVLAVTTVCADDFRAEVELEGEMVAAKCLEGECLHIACRKANAVFVRSLSLCGNKGEGR